VEAKACEGLEPLDLDELLLPLLRTVVSSGPAAGSTRVEPLFPNYLFIRAHMTSELLARINRLPEVRYVVGSRPNVPSPISEGEIRLVQHIAGLERDFRLGPIPERGRRARVIAGPLEGVEGLVVWRNKREARIASTISVVGQAVELVVPLDLLVLSDYDNGGVPYKQRHRGGRRARRTQRAARLPEHVPADNQDINAA
jgi:transcription antitermination factor NusG